MIFESSVLVATNTDVLSVGRLNSIPYNGQLTLLFLADLGTAAANYSLTIQKPDGDVPIDSQQVWASSSGADGVMDEREYMKFTFNATQGGHFIVSLTETGTAVCGFVAILKP
jgi:hypothetical protein